MKTCAVILAAGLSTRMVKFKPLIHVKESTVLEHCARMFRSAGVDEILAVTGHRHGETANECRRLQIKNVHNPDYELGMMSSVQAGVKALPADTDAFFILPVDIFLVRPWTVSRLSANFQTDRPLIAYPSFQGQRGHPPLISARLRETIAESKIEGGLRRILEQYEQDAVDVTVFDRNILLDMDHPEDFSEMKKRAEKLTQLDSQEAWELVKHVYPISEKGIAHGSAVGKTAEALANALNRCGYNLDSELAYTCGLVHDIAKGQPEHEKTGGDLLRKMGLDKMAPIVAAHRDAEPAPDITPEIREIVYIADKMIRGARHVRIEDRFQEKLDLYSHDPEAVKAIAGRLNNALAVKSKLESILGHTLEDVVNSRG